MKNKMRILTGVICAGMLLLSACRTTSQEAETAQETPAPNETADAVIMTVDIPDNTPVADSDGKIPTSADVSNVMRDVVQFGNFYQNTAGSELRTCIQ